MKELQRQKIRLLFEGLKQFSHKLCTKSKKLIKIYTQTLEETNQMQKALQNPNPNKIAECSFCFNPSEEIRIILRSCILHIRRMLQQKKYRLIPLTIRNASLESTSSIHRLIRILFEKQQFQIIYSKGCSHNGLQSLFRQKLKCKNEQLQFVIEQVCDKLARRNYQLQIISLQVKNVENSVFQLEDSSQIELKRMKQSQSEEIKAQSQEQLVKIQQGQKLIQASPPTALNYNISFDNMPLGYNILFYGGTYYQ